MTPQLALTAKRVSKGEEEGETEREGEREREGGRERGGREG